MIPERWRQTAEQIIATHPSPSQQELAEATTQVKLLLETRSPFDSLSDPVILVLVGLTYTGLVALLSLACALLFRGGLVLRLLGVAVVVRDGSRASRPRVFWRSLVAWSPLALLPLLVGLALWGFMPSGREYTASGLTPFLTLAIYIPLVIWSTLMPKRGLQDRLAGTWLVPR
jgi:hypothetical protein